MRKLYQKYKAIKRKKNFLSKATIDEDSLTLMLGVACHNTGSKEQIQIGGHCTIGCLLQALYGGKISIGKNTYIGQQSKTVAGSNGG